LTDKLDLMRRPKQVPVHFERDLKVEAGMPIKELCRKGGFSDATYYKRRAKYGGIDVPDAGYTTAGVSSEPTTVIRTL